MSLYLLGMSHHTAPVEEREQLAIGEHALVDAVKQLMAEPGIDEGLILSTCNRIEVVVQANDQDNGGAIDLRRFLERLHGRDLSPFLSHFYERQDRQVVRHVFRVASSLDSLMVGEPQILGQIKQAYQTARSAGAVRSQLDALLRRAFSVAKRVRTETEIASQPVSVSHAAVDLARQIFGSLEGRTVMLIGAGEMGELAARYLLTQGASKLLVVNRTLARAETLAAKFQAEAHPLANLRQLGERADVLITCTGAPHPIIQREDAAHFLARRRYRPMLYLDIAVPRDVDPAVHRLDNAFVYNVDDLEQVVNENIADRQREAMRAEAIIEEEVEKFFERLQARGAAPLVKALQKRAEDLRQLEVQRMRNRLGPLTPEQEQAVEALTRGLLQKWLHSPMVALRKAAAEEDGAFLLDAAAQLFDVKPDDEDGSEQA